VSVATVRSYVVASATVLAILVAVKPVAARMGPGGVAREARRVEPHGPPTRVRADAGMPALVLAFLTGAECVMCHAPAAGIPLPLRVQVGRVGSRVWRCRRQSACADRQYERLAPWITGGSTNESTGDR